MKERNLFGFISKPLLTLACLTISHTAPVEEAVEVVYKEHHKAKYHRKHARVGNCRQNPKHDKNHIVYRIGKGVKRTAQEGKIRRHKARKHRSRAYS